MSIRMIDFLNKCKDAYYKGKPIIADSIYDELADKFNFYDIGHKQLNNRVQHIFPMYSLEKYYHDDTPPTYNAAIVSPKLDGAAIELVYSSSVLTIASTRGNGKEGEDITDKFLNSKLAPLVINEGTLDSMQLIQVVGEVVAAKDIKNSRNYASGALHLKDIEEFNARELIFIAYGIKPYPTSTFMDDMMLLRNAGFLTVIDSNWAEYPQDGVVFRCNSNEEFMDLGYTSKHPKGAFALKNKTDVATEETKLLDVIWQVGKGGKVTPVAIFEDIVIDDAKINRATLHNPGFIEDMELCIGDIILVTRSGGIIPKVVGKL